MANPFTREPAPRIPYPTFVGWLAFSGLLVWGNYRDWAAIMSAILGFSLAGLFVLVGLRGAARVVGSIGIAFYYLVLLAIRD